MAKSAKSETGPAIAVTLAEFATGIKPAALPPATFATIRLLMLDVAGLCVAARRTDYVDAAARQRRIHRQLAPRSATRARSVPTMPRSSTAPPRTARITTTRSRAGPVHAGAVIVPAVLAIAEHRGLDGRRRAEGHRGRPRGDVPHEPRRAAGDPQGVLPSDRGASARLPPPRRRHRDSASSPEQIAHAIGIARQSRLGHHRVSRRRQLDQAAARRLRRAVRHPRRAARGSRLHRPRARCSKAARLLQGVRAVEDAQFPAAARRPGQALGARDDRVQALRLRDDDPALHRLRDRAARARASSPTTSRAWSARSARAPCTGCGSRSQSKHAPPNGYAGKFSTPYCIAVGFIDGKAGFEQFTDERVKDKASARARREGLLRDRSERPVSAQFHRPYPRDAEGRQRARGAPRQHARRRARAADGRRDPRQVPRQRRFGGWTAAQADEVAAAIDRVVAGGKVELQAARG